jgi:4-hydroxybenzoate polyprenyltransferase
MNVFLLFLSTIIVPFARGLSLHRNHPLLNVSPTKLRALYLIKKIERKGSDILKLIRYESICPTLLLNLSGAWIAKPSFGALAKTPEFYASSFVTVSVMSASMILNDLFDMKLDQINNPRRPLVTGRVTKREAIALASGLILFSEALSMRFLKPYHQFATHMAILMISIYTPILKRMLFVKNISCASLVAFTLWFTGYAVGNPPANPDILTGVGQFIFWGSLNNELLLDIADVEGDRKNGIITVPVLYGKENALRLCSVIVHLGIIMGGYISMRNTYTSLEGFILMFLSYPLVKKISKARKYIDNQHVIRHIVRSTTRPLLITLLYFCFLARFVTH